MRRPVTGLHHPYAALGLDSLTDCAEGGGVAAPKKNPKDNPPAKLRDGARCKVIGGTHAGKAGRVTDINVSKTGNTTITVVQANGDCFKTLARNVAIA